MLQPKLSIIIPTHNRPRLLPRAVESALNQTVQALEVVVVDDASREPASLPEHPRLRVIRLDKGVGGAGARNVGTEAAQGRWVTYLDDDDTLTPNMAEVSLSALESALASTSDATTAHPPFGVISAIQKVDEHGAVLSTRMPPALRSKGKHFFLEPLEAGCSYNTKQTLVVERDTVLGIGGWDETFRSRVHSEFFLRLNPACTLIGLPVVTYSLLSHSGSRVSGNPELRQESFDRLVEKHRQAFEVHPKMFADFLFKHAVTSRQMGQNGAAIAHFLWALRLHPEHALGAAYRSTLSQLQSNFSRYSAETI